MATIAISVPTPTGVRKKLGLSLSTLARSIYSAVTFWCAAKLARSSVTSCSSSGSGTTTSGLCLGRNMFVRLAKFIRTSSPSPGVTATPNWLVTLLFHATCVSTAARSFISRSVTSVTNRLMSRSESVVVTDVPYVVIVVDS